MNTQFEKKETGTDEWLTPPEIIKSLGEFDLDPCSPIVRPWPTAKHHFTINDDGLSKEWFGRVWLNPPYSDLKIWMKKISEHRDGIALVFARTDTQAFHNYIFKYCDSMMFMKGRLYFRNVLGEVVGRPGSPSVLVSYGSQNVKAIGDSGLKGKHVYVNYTPIIVVGASPTWRSVVMVAVSRVGGEADLKTVYDLVERIAPDKIKKNRHFKAKVRQVMQYYFTRISEGRYIN